jgi:hypothetical protein
MQHSIAKNNIKKIEVQIFTLKLLVAIVICAPMVAIDG